MILVLNLCLLAAQAQAQTQPDNTAVGKWTVDAVTDVMAFGVNDFFKKKEESRKYFTAKGYENFYEAMERARFLEMIMQTGQNVSLQVTCTPKVTGPSDKDGSSTWIVEIPADVSYQKADKTQKDTEALRVVVQQVKDPINPDGFAIDQYIATRPDFPDKDCAKSGSDTVKPKTGPTSAITP
jgi:hypothetical protein